MNLSEQYMQNIKQLLEGKPQAKFWNFMLDHATAFNNIDWERSKDISSVYQCQGRMCFKNAVRVAMVDKSLRYCEGLATAIIPTEHAWLLDKDGVVIDPTWCLLKERYHPDYFGIVIPVQFAAKHYASNLFFLPAWVKYMESQKKGAS